MHKKGWARDKRIRSSCNTEIAKKVYNYILINFISRFPKSSNVNPFQRKKIRGDFTKLQNRCYLTGRPKGVVFGLARQQFKQLIENGKLRGFTKASW